MEDYGLIYGQDRASGTPLHTNVIASSAFGVGVSHLLRRSASRWEWYQCSKQIVRWDGMDYLGDHKCQKIPLTIFFHSRGDRQTVGCQNDDLVGA